MEVERRVESALKDKMSALEDKLQLMNEAREAEERLIQVLTHVKILEEHGENKQKIIASLFNE